MFVGQSSTMAHQRNKKFPAGSPETLGGGYSGPVPPLAQSTGFSEQERLLRLRGLERVDLGRHEA